MSTGQRKPLSASSAAADRDPDLEAAARSARAAVLEQFRADSCIATTRVVIAVLRYLGVPARPAAVRVAAHNAAADQLARAGIAVRDWPAEAYSVGVAASGQHRPGRWDGHLVALTASRLIDGSLDQLSRPDRGICLPGPGVFQAPSGWGRPGSPAARFKRADGTIVSYQAVRDRGWRRSPDWAGQSALIRSVTAAAIRQLRASS